MNQPDLGLKISELRQQKGFTQENWPNIATSARARSSASRTETWNRARSRATA